MQQPKEVHAVAIQELKVRDVPILALREELEKLRVQLARFEQDKYFDDVRMEGFTARIQGLAASANPYFGDMITALSEELVSRWRCGWDEADHELSMERLVAAGTLLMESVHENESGTWVDSACFSVFAVAVTEAQAFSE